MYRKTKRIVRKWIYILLSVFMVLSILTGTAAAVSAAPQQTAPDGVVLVNHLFGSKTTIDANGYAYDFTGLIQQDGTWYYITDGSWDSTYNGVYQNPNGEKDYIRDGVWDSSYNGIGTDKSSHSYVVQNGVVNTSINGYTNLNGTWYKVKNGEATGTATGIIKTSSGKRMVVNNGRQDSSYTGMMDSGNSTYYIQNGTISDNSGTYSIKQGPRAGNYTLSHGKVIAVKLNVPRVNQKPSYPTGCEAASSASLLQYYGYPVTVSEMVRTIPRQYVITVNGTRYGPSIYQKFAGNPRHGYTSASPGYGAFAPVVTKAMNQAIANHGGTRKAKNITGASTAQLYQNLRHGKPMLVWATYNMNNPKTRNSWYYKGSDGKWHYFSYPRGTHVMVLRGYDANHIYVMDPYGATYKTFSRSAFASHYRLLGCQAIEID